MVSLHLSDFLEGGEIAITEMEDLALVVTNLQISEVMYRVCRPLQFNTLQFFASSPHKRELFSQMFRFFFRVHTIFISAFLFIFLRNIAR